MKKNSLKKTSCEFEIVELNDLPEFGTEIKDKKITIYDKKIVLDVIDNQFLKKYKNILYIIVDLNSSEDATDTDYILVRDQIDELKNTILVKYKNHLSKDILNKYLKMLLILDSKLVMPERHRGR